MSDGEYGDADCGWHHKPCKRHGGNYPYWKDEWYDERWKLAIWTLDELSYPCLKDGDLAEIGVALRTAVAAWETEATKRGLTIETTEENNG